MQRVLLRSLGFGRNEPRVARRLLFSHNCSAIRQPYQCRHPSKRSMTYEIPDIHFGKEFSPSSSKPHFTLRTSLYLPISLHRVWDNFHVPSTLNAITPPHLNFVILSPQPVQMREGTIIDYRCSKFTQTAPLSAIANGQSNAALKLKFRLLNIRYSTHTVAACDFAAFPSNGAHGVLLFNSNLFLSRA
jgi:hypothetical protein